MVVGQLSRTARGRAGTAVRAGLVAAGSLAASALLATVLARLAGSAWADLTTVALADPADVLTALCAGVGAGLAGWLGLGTAAAALAQLPGAAGSVARTVAHRIAPAALRRWVALLLGSALLGTFAPGTAVAGVRPGATAGWTIEATPSPTSLATGSPTPTGDPPIPRFGPATESPTGPAPPATATATAGPTAPTGPTATTGPSPSPGFLPTAPRPPAATPPQLGPLAATPREPGTVDHVVRRGDTLWDIAARHLGPRASVEQVAREWPRWHAANRAVIGPDPDHIEPGQRLIAP